MSTYIKELERDKQALQDELRTVLGVSLKNRVDKTAQTDIDQSTVPEDG